MRSSQLMLAIALAASPVFAQAPDTHSYIPAQGFVPNAETAISIAVAIWGPIYGRENVASEQPYRATLRGETWTVEGSLAPGHLGGVAIAEISKRDGRIRRVSHGK
jgi:hypothetical protein